MTTPVLGYWYYRGLGEPIRCLLHYLGVKYDETTYTFGPAPNYSDCPWYNTEHKRVGLDFPNLPYLIDGDLRITQSNSILRYLVQKYGGLYLPDGNVIEVTKFDVANGHVMDILMTYHIGCYSKTFEQDKEALGERARFQLKYASDYLGNKEWFVEGKLSHIDFLFFEAVDTLPFAFPKILDEFPNLITYRQRFLSLPAIAEYKKTASRWPILAPKASFGGKGEQPKC